MSENWTESVVVMEVIGDVVLTIVGEDIEFTKFLMCEFPNEVLWFVKPGFTFEWSRCEGVFSISHCGDDPAG